MGSSSLLTMAFIRGCAWLLSAGGEPGVSSGHRNIPLASTVNGEVMEGLITWEGRVRWEQVELEELKN